VLGKWAMESLGPGGMGSQGSAITKVVPRVLKTEGSDLKVLLENLQCSPVRLPWWTDVGNLD